MGFLDPPTFSRAEIGDLNVLDYGAAGDGTTNDGPAIKAALDALGDAGGGTLVFPPGEYVMSTPVEKNFQGLASSVSLRGSGSASKLLIKTGRPNDALSLNALTDLLIENLFFVGSDATETDAFRTLALGAIHQARIRGCGFYGLSSIVPGGAIVWSFQGGLEVKECQFRGCATSIFNGALGVVTAQSWIRCVVEDTDFIDYGYLAGFQPGPSDGSGPWILALSVDPPPFDGALGNGTFAVRRCVLDEGADCAIRVDPDPAASAPIAVVDIEQVRINGSQVGPGVNIRFADYTKVRESWIGYYADDTVRDALLLHRAGHVVLDGVRCQQSMSRITTTGNTLSLTLRNCIYGSIDSPAPTIMKGELPALLQADGDIAALPSGKGVLVTSPNGEITRRIGIDDAGAVVLTDPAGSGPPPTNGPSTIPETVLWLKPEQLAAYGADSSLTTWKDSSALSHDATQGTASKRPTVAKSIFDGMDGLRFDGVNDSLQANFTLAQPWELFLVGRFVVVGADKYLVDGSNADSGAVFSNGGNDGSISAFAGKRLGMNPPGTAFHLFNVTFNGTSSVTRLDGTDNGAGDLGARSSGGITLGAHAGGDYCGNVEIVEVVQVAGALTGSQRTSMRNYFDARYPSLRLA